MVHNHIYKPHNDPYLGKSYHSSLYSIYFATPCGVKLLPKIPTSQFWNCQVSLATLEAHNSLVSTWIEKFWKVFETPNSMECCIFFLNSSKLNETIDNARWK
jgi:hypothetical protein